MLAGLVAEGHPLAKDWSLDLIEAQNVTEVVADYADAHPEKRETSGYLLLRMATAEAWPCRKPQQ